MGDQPLVSVITSCYNHEKYLDEYFQGLLSQTYPSIELILFDDGSTDRSWEKICNYKEKLKKKLKRVVLQRHENMGPLKELALALKESSGEFVSILESVDYYFPEKISENINFFKSNPDFGAVHSDVNHIHENHVEEQFWMRNKRIIPQGEIFENLLTESCFIRTCTACYRMDLFKRYIDFNRFELRGYFTGDTAIWLSLAKHTKFGYLNEALACYRIVPGSLSRPRNVKMSYEFWLNANKIQSDFIREYGVSQSAQTILDKRYYEALFSFSQEVYSKEGLFKAYHWLTKNYPQEYKKLSTRLIKISAYNKYALKLVRCLVKCRNSFMASR